jgi:hypothetical protein
MSTHMRLKRRMRSAVRQHRLAKKERRQQKFEPFGRPNVNANFRQSADALFGYFRSH